MMKQEEIQQKVEAIINKMTLEQKVGQMLVYNFCGAFHYPLIYKHIKKFHCSGIRLTQTAINPQRDGFWRQAPYVSPKQYAETLNSIQDIALERPLGIPLHFVMDQEGDLSSNYCMGGVNYLPSQAGLVATGDPELAKKAGYAVAKQMKSVGIHWLHSAVLDVNINYKNPEINVRAFSDDPEVCSLYGAKFMEGLKEGGLISTAKHFPGRGDSDKDAHFEIISIDATKDELLERDIKPYSEHLKNIPSIMLAHTAFPALDPSGLPATISKPIVTDFLRNELGYEGVITTDNMEMKGISKLYTIPEACLKAVEAGADLVLMKAEDEKLSEQTFTTLLNAVKKGDISVERIEASNRRVLTLKMAEGIFDKPKVIPSDAPKALVDEKVIKIARESVEKGIKVLRNNDSVLPLKDGSKILVIEQVHKPLTVIHYEDYWNHSGKLGEEILKRNISTEHVLMKWNPDDEDLTNIKKKLDDDFDVVVITGWTYRSLNSFKEIIDIVQNSGNQVVHVVNSPYPHVFENNAEAIVVSYQVRGSGLEILADALFDMTKATGKWPLSKEMGKY